MLQLSLEKLLQISRCYIALGEMKVWNDFGKGLVLYKTLSCINSAGVSPAGDSGRERDRWTRHCASRTAANQFREAGP